MIKMIEVSELANGRTLFQCPSCKKIEVMKNRTPECTCEDDLVEEYFGTRGKSLLGGDIKE